MPSFPVPPSSALTAGHWVNSYGPDLSGNAPVSPGQLSWDITDARPACTHIFSCQLH